VVAIDCAGKSIREITLALRRAAEEHDEIVLRNPAARHNLAIGVTRPVRIVVDGTAGYFCGGMLKEGQIVVRGNCGWSVGSDQMSGSILVEGNASAAAGAAMRGGLLVVKGNAGPRTGISMKGGTLVVGGKVGYMSAFMMQKGTMVVCGDAGEGLGDSLYEGRIFVGGEVDELGNGATIQTPTTDEEAYLGELLDRYGIPRPRRFKKVVSDKRLYNFDKKEFELWRTAF
jgi:methylamine---glutamate N-methyltransferase subunit B